MLLSTNTSSSKRSPPYWFLGVFGLAIILYLVALDGFEPSISYETGGLSSLREPFRHKALSGGESRIRTGMPVRTARSKRAGSTNFPNSPFIFGGTRRI